MEAEGKNSLEDCTYYLLVTFDDRSVAVISSTWMRGANRCYWPNDSARSLAKKHAPVQRTWKLYKCRILTSSASFKKLLEKEKHLEDEDTSNIETEPEVELTAAGRPKRHAQRSLEDSDSDIEQTPTKKKTKKQSLQPLAAAPPAVSMPARDECRPSISQSLLPSHDSQLTPSSSGSQTTAPPPAMSSAAHDDSAQLTPSTSQALPAAAVSLPPPQDFVQPRTFSALQPLSTVQSSSSRIQHSPGLLAGSPHQQTPVGQSSVRINNAFQTQVLQTLVSLTNEVQEMKQQLDFVTSVLQDLNGQVDSDDIQLPDGVSLPLQDEASVDAFDNILRADAELRKSLIKRLHRLGGRSLLTAVKHQLKFLLSTAAQKLYNWHGKKGKRAFGRLVLASVVTKAVRQHRRFSSAADDELREACAKFFAGARDRRDGPSTARQQRLSQLAAPQRSHASDDSDFD